MTTRRFDFVIFDWDGTLCDSTARIVECAQLACEDLGLPVPPAEQIRYYIGHSMEEIMRVLAPETTPQQQAQISERYRYHYFTQPSHEVLFEGVVDTLNTLNSRGYTLAVATGKSRHGLNHALSETHLENTFIATRTAEETASKPNPQMLHELLDVTGFAAGDTVMVGDSSVDMQLAQNAGMAAVAVKYGVHDVVDLQEHHPLAILDNLTALMTVV